jgi:hypothetical protein
MENQELFLKKVLVLEEGSVLIKKKSSLVLKGTAAPMRPVWMVAWVLWCLATYICPISSSATGISKFILESDFQEKAGPWVRECPETAAEGQYRAGEVMHESSCPNHPQFRTWAWTCPSANKWQLAAEARNTAGVDGGAISSRGYGCVCMLSSCRGDSSARRWTRRRLDSGARLELNGRRLTSTVPVVMPKIERKGARYFIVPSRSGPLPVLPVNTPFRWPGRSSACAFSDGVVRFIMQSLAVALLVVGPFITHLWLMTSDVAPSPVVRCPPLWSNVVWPLHRGRFYCQPLRSRSVAPVSDVSVKIDWKGAHSFIVPSRSGPLPVLPVNTPFRWPGSSSACAFSDGVVRFIMQSLAVALLVVEPSITHLWLMTSDVAPSPVVRCPSLWSTVVWPQCSGQCALMCGSGEDGGCLGCTVRSRLGPAGSGAQ